MLSTTNEKNALLFIEFQQEWLHPEGKLRSLFTDQEQFQLSLHNAKKIIQAVRKTSLPILHSGLAYSTNYQELGQASYGLRSVIVKRQTFASDSIGSEFAEPFKPQKNEFIVAGRTGASAFAGSNLDSYLRNNGIQNLYILGYALHVCVESTLRAAHDLGYNAILIEDACAAFTKQQRKYVLEEIVHHFGSSVTTQVYLNSIN